MTQTDSEDRFVIDIEQCPQVGDGGVAVGWVSRSIGQEDSIVLMGDFLDGIIVGIDSNTSASTDKTANNILLHTAIDKGDFEIGGTRFNVEGMFGADLFDEVDFAGIQECFIFVGIVFFADDDTSETGTAFSEESDDSAGIDARHRRNTGTGAP